MSNVPWGSEAERADYWYKAWETENTEVKRLHAELERLTRKNEALEGANRRAYDDGFNDCKKADTTLIANMRREREATKGISLCRLKEICHAEREGRCAVLPCKVGDEVFFIPQYGGKPYCGVKAGHAQHLTISSRNWRIKVREHQPHNKDFTLGKTVFLTREEAESALKGATP